MATVWEQSGDAYYATVQVQDGDRYHMTIDKLPRGGWEWSVWRQGDNWHLARKGTADTAQEAMGAAEAAAI
jgi:hypothetical protein